MSCLTTWLGFWWSRSDQTDVSSALVCSHLRSTQGGCIKLVIVDSIMALFRTDYQGRGELQARQMALGQFLKRLHQLSMEFNFAAIMTNQMTSDPSGGMTFVADPKKVSYLSL